ncbi:MAG: two-component system response regulator RppA [Patescibacteria group bacterium]
MARILIIEDEEKLVRSLKQGLEQHGHTVDYVLDGDVGERRLALHREEYDLAIIDLMLPQKTGFEVMQEIREKNIKLPVIVLTALHTMKDKVQALDLGADDYLTKPFSIDELLARIRALLRRPDQVLPPQLSIDNLVLDTASRRVFLDREEVSLTLKEFSLLEYFMRHPNQVLNREQIYSQLWDFNSNNFSNVIDVHVKNLRKKLKAKGDHRDFIETIQGVGYRLKG